MPAYAYKDVLDVRYIIIILLIEPSHIDLHQYECASSWYVENQTRFFMYSKNSAEYYW